MTELCDLDCGQHGRCVGETCLCDGGWGGDYCNAKLCDARCNEHGQCKNGTCLCVTGWNGKHCTMEGCPAGCSAHGQCRVSGEGLWECRCYDGWDGTDCAVPLEQNCGDNKDNDKGKKGFDMQTEVGVGITCGESCADYAKTQAIRNAWF